MLKNQPFSDSVITKLNGLAIYQIAGGGLGLAIIIWLALKSPSVPGYAIILYLVATLLNVFSIYCGVLLIKLNPAGLQFSLINQYLQLVNFSFLGFAFKYIAGFFILIGLDLMHATVLNFDFGLSVFGFAINGDNQIVIFNFNLVALILIVLIDKTKNEVRDDNLVKDIMKQQ